MYIRRVDIKNYGPIDDCIIEPIFREDGLPMPVIIAGQNGSGKTLVLTNIVDAIMELKYRKSLKKKGLKSDDVFKVSKKDYIKNGQNEYIVNINFLENDTDIEYMDIAAYDTAEARAKFEYVKGLAENSDFEETGFYKNILSGEESFNDKSIMLYFPTNRYYNPSWFNKENKSLQFDLNEDALDHKIGMVKQNLLEELENWLLDVLLDKQLYEVNTERKTYYKFVGNNKVAPVQVDEFVGYEGRNTNIINLINEVLKVIYDRKFELIEYARIGVSQKSNRKISVFIKQQNKEEFEVAPKFSHLSSGEVMILSLFATIIKEYDNKTNSDDFSLDDIEGIVIIDEIDQNLHIKYAKEVLPILIHSFPKIQFVLTSHSPFFLLGMKEAMADEFMYLNMPQGDLIPDLECFDEIKECYKIFVEEREDEMRTLNKIKDKIKEIPDSIIITENYTDWRHIKNAIRMFNESGQFTNLQVKFFEFNEDIAMGESNLQILLNKLASTNNGKKIIGIFDNDSQIGSRLEGKGIWELGNEVYAFCIEKPEYRVDYKNVPIEMLYKDQDLFIEDRLGRRLFLSSEFREINGRHRRRQDINYIKPKNLRGKIEIENSMLIYDDVYNENEEKVCLSRNEFANNIFDGVDRYEYADVSGFAPLLLTIEGILNR